MATKTKQRGKTDLRPIRLSSLTVTNYKALDKVQLEFPPPSVLDDLDAFVLGSKNGIGKSSFLECCALATLGHIGPRWLLLSSRIRENHSIFDLCIRSGNSHALLEAQFGEQPCTVTLKPNGIEVQPLNDAEPLTSEQADWREMEVIRNSDESFVLDSLLGMNSEPLVSPGILHFHSYRKVVEGSSALGAMVDPMFAARRTRTGRFGPPLSRFKVALIQALMAKSGLFEGIATKSDNEQVVEKLNGLLKDFAGGKVDKLRPGGDGTLELRIAPTRGGSSFSFDGLSSGQKEIIATLFLIWFATQGQPSVVLIDEPELHLNAEWQRIFIRQLSALAPQNQYILATHSEEIWNSVREDRRIMLRGE